MGGRYAQSVHSSRCPPKAAVRQRAMARNTLRCCQVIHLRLRSMKVRPAARTRSATSRGGRFIIRSALPYLSAGASPEDSLSARSALVRLAPEKSLYPSPRICSNRDHLLLQSSSASHTALLPPSTPVHRLPHAAHRTH